MHLFRSPAILLHLSFNYLVTGAPLATPHPASITAASTEGQNSSNYTFGLAASLLNGTSITANPPNTNTPSFTSFSNTLAAPDTWVPYRVRTTGTTIIFHSFGAKIPSTILLTTLSISLTFVVKAIGENRGNESIANGFFSSQHKNPNGDSVTVSVGDFQEIGRPMNYYDLRDLLRGIGDFMTEPMQRITEVSYEVEIDKVGYVGTGHVEFNPASSTA
ncbi:hypothetical protein MMC28_001445 [Mycoblastus sanguinarius]|nr:hypothetical protein [Mycoblastus sanguinarius]